MPNRVIRHRTDPPGIDAAETRPSGRTGRDR